MLSVAYAPLGPLQAKKKKKKKKKRSRQFASMVGLDYNAVLNQV